MSVFAFILILSFLVIIHELGHFLAARWAKIKVDEFGVGYPPKAFKLFAWKGTDFTLNWVPFGGFVRMQGEEGESARQDEEKTSRHGQFFQATTNQKLIVILSGAAVNFLFGIIAFGAVFSYQGIPQILPDARIGEVIDDSPAQEAGLMNDTNIVGFRSLNTETRIHTIDEAIEYIAQHKGESVGVITTGVCEGSVCSAEITEYEVYLRTDAETPAGSGSMGIVFDPVVFVFYPSWQMPFRGVAYGIRQALFLGGEILRTLSGVLINMVKNGAVSADVAGPVGIVHQAQSNGLFKQGFLTILSFSGMLSINLAVMNVLPLPPLDGGRAVFIVLESLFSKRRTQRIEAWVSYVGYALLIALIIIITIRDIVRIFM